MKRFGRLLLLAISFFLTSTNTPQAIADENFPAVQIIIDASGSMDGEKLTATKSAINETIRVLPSNVFLRLIIIRTSPEVLIDYTQNKTLVENAIANIKATGDTSLYDAITLAIDSNAKYTPNRVVVLSDGKDTASNSELDNLLRNLDQKNIPVDIVALKVSGEDQENMKTITNVSGGLFFSTTNLAELKSSYLRIFQTVIATPIASPSSPPVDVNATFSSNALERFVYAYKKLIAIFLSLLIFIFIVTYLNLLLVRIRARRQRVLRKESLNFYIKASTKATKFNLNRFGFLDTFQLPKFFERHIESIAESR
ncbi:MAG: vWA domain-containing protein, partial [Candidatus Nanopelagicaceae bacterium]